MLEGGVQSFGEAEVDLFHPKMERRGAWLGAANAGHGQRAG